MLTKLVRWIETAPDADTFGVTRCIRAFRGYRGCESRPRTAPPRSAACSAAQYSKRLSKCALTFGSPSNAKAQATASSVQTRPVELQRNVYTEGSPSGRRTKGRPNGSRARRTMRTPSGRKVRNRRRACARKKYGGTRWELGQLAPLSMALRVLCRALHHELHVGQPQL